jgi:hypothetical protein
MDALILLQNQLPLRAVTFVALVPRSTVTESLQQKITLLEERAADTSLDPITRECLAAKVADVTEWLASSDVAPDSSAHAAVMAEVCAACDQLEYTLRANHPESVPPLFCSLRWCIFVFLRAPSVEADGRPLCTSGDPGSACTLTRRLAGVRAGVSWLPSNYCRAHRLRVV